MVFTASAPCTSVVTEEEEVESTIVPSEVEEVTVDFLGGKDAENALTEVDNRSRNDEREEGDARVGDGWATIIHDGQGVGTEPIYKSQMKIASIRNRRGG